MNRERLLVILREELAIGNPEIFSEVESYCKRTGDTSIFPEIQKIWLAQKEVQKEKISQLTKNIATIEKKRGEFLRKSLEDRCSMVVEIPSDPNHILKILTLQVYSHGNLIDSAFSYLEQDIVAENRYRVYFVDYEILPLKFPKGTRDVITARVSYNAVGKMIFNNIPVENLRIS